MTWCFHSSHPWQWKRNVWKLWAKRIERITCWVWSTVECQADVELWPADSPRWEKLNKMLIWYIYVVYIYIFIYLVKLWEIVKMDLGSFLLPGNAKAIIWMMKLPNQRNRSMHPWLRIKILARRKPGLKTCASSSPHWKGRGRDCSCFALFRMFNYPPAKVDSRQAEYPNDLRLGFQK